MMDISNFKVLLIEDNELDQRAMIRNLAVYPSAKFEVRTVITLGEALAAIDEEEFDCILLDLSLPDSVGLASVDALLQQSPESPVVVLTGLEDPSVAVQAVERGAQDYLTKQLAGPDLVGRSIRYAVARQSSETQLRTAESLLTIMQDRERIARDLHDNVIQQLFATGLGLQSAAALSNDPAIVERLDHAVENIDNGIRQLREAIFGLNRKSAKVGLDHEILEIVESQAVALGFSPSIRLTPDAINVCPDVRHELLAALREALSNIARHASATAAQVIVNIKADYIELKVSDNGIGLRPQSSIGPGDALAGNGLENMAARAADLYGELRVSPGAGGGTELSWRARIESKFSGP